MTDPTAWGIFAKLDQELAADGKAIGSARYEKSFKDSALYEQQAGVPFFYYGLHVVVHKKIGDQSLNSE